MYQFFSLESSRAKNNRDKKKSNQKFRKDATNYLNDSRGSQNGCSSTSLQKLSINYASGRIDTCLDWAMQSIQALVYFLRKTQTGKTVAFLSPFFGLILIGAAVVGSIENWTVIESLFFSVESLTTVGFGDLYPTKTSSIWFCIFWLPSSVGFMSLYLSNIAQFYIEISNRNVMRIERNMRKKMRNEKMKQANEREDVMGRCDSGGFFITKDLENKDCYHTLKSQDPPSHLSRSEHKFPLKNVTENEHGHGLSGFFFGTESSETRNVGYERRRLIKQNSGFSLNNGNNLQVEHDRETMKDLINIVKLNLVDPTSNNISPIRNLSLTSRKHYISNDGRLEKQPTFALRVLVMERIAQIIARDVVGFQSNVEIRGDTLSVTIERLSSVGTAWKIPERARKAFRAVAFESLYFVGEHNLVVHGENAIFSLKPFEVNNLFGPLLATIGDSDSMEAWLSCTQDLLEMKPGTEHSIDVDTDGFSYNRLTRGTKPKNSQKRQQEIIDVIT